MLVRIIPLAIPFLLVACGGSSKATTGKEFLTKFKKAIKAKEASTVRDMMSRNTQLMLENELMQEIQNGYYSENQKNTLLEEFQNVRWTGDGDKDLRQIKPKVLFLDRLQRKLDAGSIYREFRDYRFENEKPKGKGILLNVKNPGNTKIGIVLVLENDYLKYDQELTVRYATEKR